MAEHTVLRDQHRREPVRVLEEETVVADAKAHYDIELAAMRVQQLGLAHRVAQGFELPRAHLLVVGDSHLFLRDAARLAGNRHHLEAMALENAAKDVSVIDETDAVGDADLLVTHPLGELNDLLDPALARDFAYLGVLVEAARLGLSLGVDLGRAEAGPALGGLALAAGPDGTRARLISWVRTASPDAR